MDAGREEAGGEGVRRRFTKEEERVAARVPR